LQFIHYSSLFSVITPEKTAAILEEECKRFRSQYEGQHPVSPAAYPAMWAAATKWGAAVSNSSNSVPAIKQEKQSVPHLLAEMVEQQQQQQHHQHQQHPQQQQQHPQSPVGGGGGGADSPYPTAVFFNGGAGGPNSGGGSGGGGGGVNSSAEALYESMSQVYPALTSSLGELFSYPFEPLKIWA
jgi:hypothetical protein